MMLSSSALVSIFTAEYYGPRKDGFWTLYVIAPDNYNAYVISVFTASLWENLKGQAEYKMIFVMYTCTLQGYNLIITFDEAFFCKTHSLLNLIKK